jgi:asparagine synthase (glutamine-hydrolysing)
MCGITGWVSFARDLRSDQASVSAIDAMTQTMGCRGPDDQGTWITRHAALGHRRLAVIDLPGGRQPMSLETPDGPLVIVYSGETYNFTELRAELAGRGHRFATESDTEVVLHAYLDWGEAFAERLNGMYALAIWDSRSGKLVMVRDRMGIKPLYYYETPDGVLFGSEPKAVLASPLAGRTVSLDGLREMFAWVKTPGHAVFDGMREVEPGTVVTVSRAGLRTTAYWNLETRPHLDDRDATVGHVRELLEDIVRRQLVADVPQCTLLSGGLDSSAMTAIAARQLAEKGEQVRSFAVDFTGQTENFVPDPMRGTPDAPFARDVAEKSRTDHQTVMISSGELTEPAVREAVVRAREFCTGLADMDVSLYLLFRALRETSTVALSGESADEVFGGYKWFFDPEVRKGTTFPWLLGAAQALSGDVQHVLVPDLARLLDLPAYVNDAYATAVAKIQRLDGESGFEWQMRKICYLHLTRFVRVLLDRKDRMSMAVGLEVRVPFCDHRLVEYAYNAPWSLKTYDGQEKSLLRGAIRDLLPDSVVKRVKAPYPSTQDPAYAARLQHIARDQLSQPGHPVFDLVSRDWLSRVTAPGAEVTPDRRRGIERALDLALWLDMYKPTLKTS